MDIRIKRTKKMLEDALFELMKEKPVEKITPTELCKHATVNRNTFYSHYGSVTQLYETVENRLIESVDKSLAESDSTVEAIVAVCKMLKENRNLSNIVFKRNFGSKVMNRVFALTNSFNMKKLNEEKNDLSENYKQMLSSFTIMGSAAALECWVKNGMKEEPKDIAEFIFKISKNGSFAVTK